MYLSLSCIIWTFSSPSLPDLTLKGCYPLSMAARMEMCFRGERRGKTEMKEERKRSQVAFCYDFTQPSQSVSVPPLCIQHELGHVRGCSDFSPGEERSCVRGSQHSGCLPFPSFTFDFCLVVQDFLPLLTQCSLAQRLNI